MFLRTFNSEFSYIEVWFTEGLQNCKLPEIEDKLNITLAINEKVKRKNDSLLSSTKRFEICKRLWILVFCKNYGQKYQ